MRRFVSWRIVPESGLIIGIPCASRHSTENVPSRRHVYVAHYDSIWFALRLRLADVRDHTCSVKQLH